MAVPEAGQLLVDKTAIAADQVVEDNLEVILVLVVQELLVKDLPEAVARLQAAIIPPVAVAVVPQ